VSSPVVVCSLLGKRQVELALTCLRSLKSLSAEPIHLRLHDDGTLEPSDRERLARDLGSPTFVLRTEADDRIASWLANYPALAAARRANPYLLKLLDIVALSHHDTVAYCDADVYFLRPFTGLFDFPSDEIGACFMQDSGYAYTLRPWQAARYWLHLPLLANSGLIYFRKRHFDLDLLEWFFSHPEFHIMPVWSEQTAWALMGARAGCWLYDDEQISVPLPQGSLPKDRIALHFVKPARERLREVVCDPSPRNGEPVPIRIRPARIASPWKLLADGVARRSKRLVTHYLSGPNPQE
jgi:hypothetical protein